VVVQRLYQPHIELYGNFPSANKHMYNVHILKYIFSQTLKRFSLIYIAVQSALRTPKNRTEKPTTNKPQNTRLNKIFAWPFWKTAGGKVSAEDINQCD